MGEASYKELKEEVDKVEAERCGPRPPQPLSPPPPCRPPPLVLCKRPPNQLLQLCPCRRWFQGTQWRSSALSCPHHFRPLACCASSRPESPPLPQAATYSLSRSSLGSLKIFSSFQRLPSWRPDHFGGKTLQTLSVFARRQLFPRG